jgi:hypothetical protein
MPIFYHEKGYQISEKEWTKLGYDPFGKILFFKVLAPYVAILRFFGRDDLTWTYEELNILGSTPTQGCARYFGVFTSWNTEGEADNMADTFKLNTQKLEDYLTSGASKVIDKIDKKPDDFLDKMPFGFVQSPADKTGSISPDVSLNDVVAESKFYKKCPLCPSWMSKKSGTYGEFWSCNNWKTTGCPATLNANGQMSKKTKALVVKKNKKDLQEIKYVPNVISGKSISFQESKPTPQEAQPVLSQAATYDAFLKDLKGLEKNKYDVKVSVTGPVPLPQEGQPIEQKVTMDDVFNAFAKVVEVNYDKEMLAALQGVADPTGHSGSSDWIPDIAPGKIMPELPELDEIDERFSNMIKNKESKNG